MNIWPFSKKGASSNYYFGLFLKAENGIGMIIERRGGSFIVHEIEKFNYSNGWEHLADDVDEALFKLESRTKLRLTECIVFLYSHLINQSSKEIRPAYLNTLKEVFKNLELKPLGYIECYEAVSTYLREKEQMPPTAVIIELDSTDLSIFVYKGGKVVFSKTQSATDNIIEDLTSLFLAMHGVLLPSRIIIYNSKDLDDASTRIVTHRWSEELFVQPPRVEIIKEDEIFSGLVKIFQEQLEQKNAKMLSPQIHHEGEKNQVAGFIIGGDVPVKNQNEDKKADLSNKKTMLPSLHSVVGHIGGIIKESISSIRKVRMPLSVLAVIGLFFIFVGLFLNEYFFHKATVTVFVPSQKVEKSFIASDRDVHLQVATDAADFSSSTPTSGKRSVGDKAKGTVTLHNFNDSAKTFTKGTQVSTAGINFILDSDTKVASASEIIVSGDLVKQPGKTQAALTASEIGEQGNLAKGKRFSIDDLPPSTYFGINDNAFSGGSKRDVQTVAKTDLQSLQSNILEKGKKQAVTRVAAVIGPENRAVDSLTSVTVAETKYSKELGEEASQLTLSAKTKATYYFYSYQTMIDYIADLVKKDVPSGMTINNKNITYGIDKSDNKGGKISLTIHVTAKAMKEVSQSELVANLIGKNEKGIGDNLKKNFEIQGYELKIQQPFPIFKHTLPFFGKNITVNISSL